MLFYEYPNMFLLNLSKICKFNMWHLIWLCVRDCFSKTWQCVNFFLLPILKIVLHPSIIALDLFLKSAVRKQILSLKIFLKMKKNLVLIKGNFSHHPTHVQLWKTDSDSIKIRWTTCRKKKKNNHMFFSPHK